MESKIHVWLFGSVCAIGRNYKASWLSVPRPPGLCSWWRTKDRPIQFRDIARAPS